MPGANTPSSFETRMRSPSPSGWVGIGGGTSSLVGEVTGSRRSPTDAAGVPRKRACHTPRIAPQPEMAARAVIVDRGHVDGRHAKARAERIEQEVRLVLVTLPSRLHLLGNRTGEGSEARLRIRHALTSNASGQAGREPVGEAPGNGHWTISVARTENQIGAGIDNRTNQARNHHDHMQPSSPLPLRLRGSRAPTSAPCEAP